MRNVEYAVVHVGTLIVRSTVANTKRILALKQKSLRLYAIIAAKRRKNHVVTISIITSLKKLMQKPRSSVLNPEKDRD